MHFKKYALWKFNLCKTLSIILKKILIKQKNVLQVNCLQLQKLLYLKKKNKNPDISVSKLILSSVRGNGECTTVDKGIIQIGYMWIWVTCGSIDFIIFIIALRQFDMISEKFTCMGETRKWFAVNIVYQNHIYPGNITPKTKQMNVHN